MKRCTNMKLKVVAVAAWALIVCCSCSHTIRGKPVGSLTVEDAFRLYMKHPTVIEWLTKTEAEAVYFPDRNFWKIQLKDGWILYTEHTDKNGIVYVDQIEPRSDNPDALKKIPALRAECQKIMENKRTRH